MNISVAQLMSERVIAVRENAGFAEVVTALRRFQIASLPVIDADRRVIGLLSEDDVLAKEAGSGQGAGPLGWRRRRAYRRKMAATTAGELMTSPAVTVTPDTPARETARLMHRHGVHQLPVADAASGRLVGIITRSDLLRVYERPDEDIRREILYDVIEDVFALDPERFAVTVADGTATVRGHVEHRTAAVSLAEAIERVEGLVSVKDHLTYRHDDAPTVPGPPS